MDLLKLKDFYPLIIEVSKFLWKSDEESFKEDARLFTYGALVISFMIYLKNSIKEEN